MTVQFFQGTVGAFKASHLTLSAILLRALPKRATQFAL
jgi:hypothetical protein